MNKIKSPNSILSEMECFFHPRSLAIVGVSSDPSKFGNILLRAIRDFGYEGQIYPINPKLKQAEGYTAYPSILSIPGKVDAAYICTGATTVISAVKECKEKGIPAITILSAGFKETGTEEGRKLEEEVKILAGDGLHIIGPNCFGVHCPAGGITQISGENNPRESGPLGIISQSGGLSEEICRAAKDNCMNVSMVTSYGNACDITEAELLRYLEADENTKIIGAYIEGTRKGREFFSILQRLVPKKPVIIFKGGLTPSGARMVSSHTASLGGSEQIWNAIFKQTGATRVDTFEELMDTASAFYHLPTQTDNRIALICGGGGVSVAATDACYYAGLQMASLSDDLRNKIAKLLPPVGSSANNPVDVAVPFPPAEVVKGIAELLASSGEVGSIILDKVTLSSRLRKLFGYSSQIIGKEKAWLKDIPVIIAKKYRLPVIVVLREGGSALGKADVEAENHRLSAYYRQNGVAVYPNVQRALKSLGKVIAYNNRFRKGAMNNLKPSKSASLMVKK